MEKARLQTNDAAGTRTRKAKTRGAVYAEAVRESRNAAFRSQGFRVIETRRGWVTFRSTW